MIKLYVATGDAVAVIGRYGGAWEAELHLQGKHTQCVAADPRLTRVVYCGTFDAGLWCSEDAGRSWRQVGAGIPHRSVMSVAVSTTERRGNEGVVWAGTEPSAIFRSEDGGRSWQERPALRQLPSAPTWSFPPRPQTSHVRWIQLDPNVPGHLLASIEAGGVMRSDDGGATWVDRHSDTPFDAHTLAMHPRAPGRVYAACGDGFMRPGNGYAESHDGGATWQRFGDGLTYHYLWSVAIDPVNPNTIVVSASPGPMQAHDPRGAEAALFRRVDGRPWRRVEDGLPPAKGSRTFALATNPAESGVFYAVTRGGDLYRSIDSGQSWERLPVAWPGGYRPPDVDGLVAVDV